MLSFSHTKQTSKNVVDMTFKENKTDKTTIPHQIQLTSKQNQSFTEAADKDTDKIFEHKQTLLWYNISKGEKNIMYTFSKEDDLLFTTANKGGDTIIIDVGNYVKKAKKY